MRVKHLLALISSSKAFVPNGKRPNQQSWPSTRAAGDSQGVKSRCRAYTAAIPSLALRQSCRAMEAKLM